MATDDELRFHREQRDRALAQYSLSSGPGTNAAAAARAAAFYEQVITPPIDQDYTTPDHFAYTVEPRGRRDLADLLHALREYRRKIAGLTLGDAQVIYNGDDHARLLSEEFVRWMLAHVGARLAKRHPKDAGDSVLKFRRLQAELVPWLEGLLLKPNSGHIVPLPRLHHRLSWELYRGTWSSLVVRDANGLVRGVRTGHAPTDEVLKDVLIRHHWHREGLVASLASTHSALTASGPTVNHATELTGLVADLVEMRGLLSRSFVPSEHVIELAPGVFGGWHWELGNLAGTVELNESAAEVSARLQSGNAGYAIGLDMAGTPRELTTPWVDLPPAVTSWALGVVRPIHAHLLALWDAAERPGPTSADRAPSVDDGLSIAVACEALARGDRERATGESDRDSRPTSVPAVRAVTLFTLLERVFSVEVKRGKGSEITVYRSGGRKYTLPGHKRNVHFPSHVVRAMLRALGIGAREFREAVGR